MSLSLFKYLYANGDPGNVVDPSGRFGLGLISVALDIGSSLSMTNVTDPGISLFAGGSDDHLGPRQQGALILANLSSGSSNLIRLQLKKSSDKPTIRNNSNELQMLQKKDVTGYYMSRLSRGDFYASLALEVVRDQGFLGTSANLWLQYQVNQLPESRRNELLNGGTYSGFQRRVNVALANLHAYEVDVDFQGSVYGLLSRNQIRDYHESYFIELGLPKVTFGGAIMGFMGLDSFWCEGCDVE